MASSGPDDNPKLFLAGLYELVIDNKNRLSIPFAIRRKLHEDRDGHAFYALPGRRKGTVSLYPQRHYERLCAHLAPDNLLSESTFNFRQFECARSAPLDPDGQGRVLLPDSLLKRMGLGPNVVLIGVRDHLELWRPEDFAAFDEEMWSEYPERRAKAVDELNRLSPTAWPAQAVEGN